MASQRKAGALFGYANILAKNLVNLVYAPMLLSFVGQADYGVFQSSNSFVFSLTLLSFGFSEAYVRFYTRERVGGSEEGVRRLNGMYLVLYSAVTLVAVAVGLGFSANARAIFSKGFTAAQVGLARELLAIMTVNVASTLFTVVFNSYITAHERFVYQQTRQLFTTLATPVCAYLLLRAGMGPVGVALAQLGVNLVLLALNARYAIVVLGMRFELRGADWGVMRGVAAFSAWIFANQVCDMVNQSVPNIMLGALSGASAVAVFAVAVNIRQVFFSISTTMSNVFIPKINRIVATSDDNAELTCLMTRVGRYQMVLFCWVYGGFAVLGRFFMSKWAGEGFSEAYWLVLAMTLPVMVPLTQNTGVEIQRAKNMHRARSLVYLAMAGINVLFTVAAAPAVGYWAPAIAYIVSIALGNGLWMNWYYQARVGLDMGYFWHHNLPVCLAGAAVTAVLLLLVRLAPVSSWVGFLAWGAAYTVLFAAAMWQLVLDSDEKAGIAARLPFLR